MIGTRIRERRLSQGLKQGQLAAKVGISASYLNLIEHNRRRVGGKTLKSVALVLGVDPASLAQGAQADLVSALSGAAQSGVAKIALGDDVSRASEMADRFPGWAQLIALQSGRIAQLEALVDGLNDRLTHDPVLSDTMHDVLSTVSAIRSTASILVGTPDLDADWRQRFHANIDKESRRLAETSAAMAEHFEHLTRSSAAYVTPLEATQALFDSHAHHFPLIETLGAAGVDEVLKTAQLPEGPTQDLARTALLAYAQRAADMPLDDVTSALRNPAKSEPDALAAAFRVPLSDMLQRLAELPHVPGLPETGSIRVDGAGAVLMRKQVAGFPVPRFGAVCSLWPVFTALSRPGQPIRQTVQTSEAAGFTVYALSRAIAGGGFDAAPIYQAIMIMRADSPEAPSVHVGPACRICPRVSCVARREPSIIDSFAVPQNRAEEF